MPDYSNGYIPDSLLVTFHTGWTAGEGAWKHQLSPGTYAKHKKLVALAMARTGRLLTIGPGWGAYRPFFSQEFAFAKYGNGAAWPGTSSHGGFWEEQQTLAMDYDNWGWVYDWDRDAFYADVRAAGLDPGLIHPSRGNNYPDEPWHVVDLDPWAPAPAGGKDASTPAEEPEEEDEDMPKNSGVWYKKDTSTYVYLVFNTGSGFAHEFSNGTNAGTMPGNYTAGLKAAMEIAGWSEVTPGHAQVIKNGLAAVRPKDAPKEIEITIVSQAELDALDA